MGPIVRLVYRFLVKWRPTWFMRHWFRVGVTLNFIIPPLALLALDYAKAPLVLRMAVVLLPILDLYQQLHIWYHHITRFGIPRPATIYRMWALDALRAYRGAVPGGVLASSPRGNVASYVAVFLLASLVFAVAWRATSLSAMLYFAVVYVMMAIKRTIRLARPPAVLLLGASSSQCTDLQLALSAAVAPLQVVSCIRHLGMSGGLIYFNSYRTASENQWKRLVTDLLQIAPRTLVDLRGPTERVMFEISEAIRLVPPDHLFFAGAVQPGISVPPLRCFEPTDAIRALRLSIEGGSTRARRTARAGGGPRGGS